MTGKTARMMESARERLGAPLNRTLCTPMVWLVQNLRNRVLLAQYNALKTAPILISLGDCLSRPSYRDRFFTSQLRERLGMQGPVMVDSGGYALMSQRSSQLSLKEIERIYSRLTADILVSLDYPPVPEDDRVTRRRLRVRTLRNLKRLRDVVPPRQLMPVVHGHSVEELVGFCEGVKALCPHPKMIGVGGLVPLLCSGGPVAGFCYERKDGTNGDRIQWIGDALQIVREHFPGALVHVFGIGSATTAIGVLGLGADSIDSLSWRRVANYGAIILPGRSERFPAFREGRVRSRPVVGDQDLPLLMACMCPVCMMAPSMRKRLAALANCYKKRAIHNAWTVLTEVAAFRAAIQIGRECEFLKSRLARVHRFYRPVMARLQVLRGFRS